MPRIRQRRTRLSHDIMQPTERLPEQRTHSTPKGVGGEGKPGCAFGPHGGGENQSVRVGPSPLYETRTKNRRSITDWKTSIDLTRIGMEHTECEASSLISLLVLCNILVLADSLPRIDHPRCVSAKNTCIFYRTLTPALTCCRERERSGRWRQSGAAFC